MPKTHNSVYNPLPPTRMRAYLAPGSWQHGELVADDENTPNTNAARSQLAA
ncbi:MAG TPA: hypothetical protein VGM65_16855 [Candidatus Udaeobacter sp.]